MKTHPSLKIVKLPTLAPLGIAIAAALVTQPLGASVINSVAVDWAEPENSSEVNLVNFTALGSVLAIISESLNRPSTVPNGTTVTGVGTDSSNGGSISATFFDKGDAARVPETGSTLGLLFVSLIALLGTTRLRHVQLA